MRLIICLLVTLTGLSLSAQRTIFTETFDQGLEFFTSAGTWTIADDGQGSARLGIRSASRGPAALHTRSDVPGSLTAQTDVSAPTSPDDRLTLSFYTHFQSSGGQITVLVSDLTSQLVFDTILVDESQEARTSSVGAYYELDLGEQALNQPVLVIQFLVEGAIDYMLLDDITLSYDRAERPSFPRRISQRLDDLGIPYVISPQGAPVTPFELVLNFAPGESQDKIKRLAEHYKANRIQTCVCERIEVWEFPGGVFFDPVTGEPLGDATEIYARTKPLDSDNDIGPDGVDYNYLQYDTLQSNPARAPEPLPESQFQDLEPEPSDAVKIAILDTGVDFEHPMIRPYIYRNDERVNGADDDSNCYADDVVGYNFMNDNNNTLDNNGHGTHVAGIVAQNLPVCEGCTYQIVPYKVQDAQGVGTLFAASCAILQASVNDDARVINASWGYYGEPATILRNAIDTARAYGVVFVASAGNDSLLLDVDPRWPAAFTGNHLMTVGAIANGREGAPVEVLAGFSNYSEKIVELLAPGQAIQSAKVGGGLEPRSGTSMSAPAVSGAAAERICRKDGKPEETIEFLLGTATKTTLDTVVVDGNVLNAEESCPTGVFDAQLNEFDMMLYPNPTFDDTNVEFGETLRYVTVRIFNAAGKVIAITTLPRVNPNEKICFSLGSVAPGLYLVTAEADGRRSTRRLIKR